jgi:hypothetical protein
MSDPVPAIAEAAATGEIAAIFADIRHVLGVGVVNLIWRHLAVIPGALPWAWGMLRPLYVDGTIAAEAKTLHEDLDLPRLLVLPPEALSAAGLLGSDIIAIRNILAAYHKTNAMAIIALSALLSRLDDELFTLYPASVHDGALRREPQPAIPLPRLLNLVDLSSTSGGLVMILNRLGTRRADSILASMYRHLAHWPPYLALAWTMIAPLDADGRLGRSIADAVAKARTRAGRVAVRPHITPSGPLESANRTAIRAAIEPFTGDVIGKMVVICEVLRAASGGS